MKKLPVILVSLFLLAFFSSASVWAIEITPNDYAFSRLTATGAYDYADESGTGLIDGEIGTVWWPGPAGNGEYLPWVAWDGSESLDIAFSFDPGNMIDSIALGAAHGTNNGIALPSSIEIFSRPDDTQAWVSQGVITPPAEAQNDFRHTLAIDSLAIADPYVKLTFTPTSGQFIFVDEVAFGGNNAPAAHAPEPATILLLGSGLAGLAGFGRRKFKK